MVFLEPKTCPQLIIATKFFFLGGATKIKNSPYISDWPLDHMKTIKLHVHVVNVQVQIEKRKNDARVV